MKDPEKFCALTATNFRALTGAEAYSCRFGDRSGWAIIFLHEETGTVAIHSDYGDWVFSWPSPGRGPSTLKEFICHGSYDYLAGKFTMGLKEQIDGEQTQRVFIRRLLEEVWHHDTDADTARPLYDELKSADWGSSEAFYLSASDELKEWMGGDWYESIVYDQQPEFYWLKCGILPALVAELRKTLPEKVAV